MRPLYLVVVTFFSGMQFWDLPWPAQPDQLLAASLTVGAVVIGFIVSAKAILISNTSRPMENLRKMGMMIELTDAFAMAIYLGMTFTVFSTIGFFGVRARWYEAVWSALGIGMLYSFLKVARFLFRLVRDY